MQKTNYLTPYIYSLLVLISVLAASLIFSPSAHAAIRSNDLKTTIAAKCDLAIAKYPDSKKNSDDYKDFEDACLASGDYQKDGTKLEERAKRLLVVCSYKSILKVNGKYDAYNSRGVAAYKDCDSVKNNKELKKLADKAYPGNSAIKKVKDPALKCASASHDDKLECDLMKKYINPIIAFLTAFVGIAVTIGIISGGIRYASAGDDPQKVSAAKQHIKSAILALLVFIFLYALIRWLVPSVVGI